MITRSGTGNMIPVDLLPGLFKGITEQSVALRRMRRLRDMQAREMKMTVLSALPTAGWVNGEAGGVAPAIGRKPLTDVSWQGISLYAEELACIVAAPEQVVADMQSGGYNLWSEVEPLIQEEMGRIIDRTVLFGENRPSVFPLGICPLAVAAGNYINVGVVGDLYDDLLSENGLVSKVELDGFFPSGHVANLSMRSKMRGLRDDNGQPIFTTLPQDPTRYALDGSPLDFPRNGCFNGQDELLITGDWSWSVYSFRQQFTITVLKEAILQDSNGTQVVNLAQEDAVAIRCVLRMGWALPNPINRVNPDANTRFPFAVYRTAPSS